MREARIIAPLTDNNGRSTLDARTALERGLIDKFGGFTCTIGYGAWRNEAAQQDHLEEVAIYDVAADDSGVLTLIDLARWFCRRAQQECVYLRLPDGDVQFIKPV